MVKYFLDNEDFFRSLNYDCSVFLANKHFLETLIGLAEVDERLYRPRLQKSPGRRKS
jgi:hypothetical protein